MNYLRGLLAAGMLLGLMTSNASAGTTAFSSTVFTGTTTTFTGNTNLLPYTDSNGRTISAVNGGTNLSSTYGLFLIGTSPQVTFSNLSSDTNQIGLSFDRIPGVNTSGNPFYIASVTFNNGDSFIAGSSYSVGANSFFAFSDTTPFTSAIVIFNDASGHYAGLTDFRTTALSAATPEPASVILFGSSAVLLGVARLRRRKNS